MGRRHGSDYARPKAVMLRSSSPLAAVPSSVTVSEGETQARFVVSTKRTKNSTRASITAAPSGTMKRARLTIRK